MKKLTAILLILVLLLSALTAFAEDADDPAALVIGEHEVTRSELKDALTLYMFEAALSCAENGYGFDIVDRLNIEDEMDKLVFDMERWYVSEDLARSMDLYPLRMAAAVRAKVEAEERWTHYREIAWSDNGMAFLPAGDYEQREDDPEGNITRYFASFGLTKDALYQKAVWEQAHDEVKKSVTAFMAGQSEDEIIDYFSDWFLGKMDEVSIREDQDVIADVVNELCEDPSEYQEGDDFESYERSVAIEGVYYTLGDSTIRDLENEGWDWTQEKDGQFRFQVTEDGNWFYARTDNGQPEGHLIMIDMTSAYDIAYEYLGYGFDRAFDPEEDADIYQLIEDVYSGEYNEEGVLQARTEVSPGTLLIELAENTLRLTLE